MSVKLPRHLELWLPGYCRNRLEALLAHRPPVQRVWLAITDHYEPFWHTTSENVARRRVELWHERWPEVAARGIRDSAGNAPVYTFFYAQEEYRPHLVEALAELVRSGIADVEVHIHHDREGRQNFIERMTRFCRVLVEDHGLLRAESGQVRFGFIHGDWALDNSYPGGRHCGLNDEITILRDLGCYADFTMPSGASPSQAEMVNVIYSCVDDPIRPKSYSRGTPIGFGAGISGDLLMIPGPFGLRWKDRLIPRMETGALAGNDLATASRVQRWLAVAPRIGNDIFIKLYTHGTQERNSGVLLGGGLNDTFALVASTARDMGASFYFVSAWQMNLAIRDLAAGLEPTASTSRAPAQMSNELPFRRSRSSCSGTQIAPMFRAF